MKKYILILCLLSARLVFASCYLGAGSPGIFFMNILSPREISMGNTNVVSSKYSSAIFYNPSNLGRYLLEKNNSYFISLSSSSNYSNYDISMQSSGFSIGQFSLAKKIKLKNNEMIMGMGIIARQVDGIIETDFNNSSDNISFSNNPLSASEIMVSYAISNKVGYNTYVGTAYNYFFNSYSHSYNGISVGINMNGFGLPIDKRVKGFLNIVNFLKLFLNKIESGSSIQFIYNGEMNKLFSNIESTDKYFSFLIKSGINYQTKIYRPVLFTVDLNSGNYYPTKINMGAELSITNNLFLRGGTSYGQNADISSSNFDSISSGVGVCIGNNFCVDISYICFLSNKGDGIYQSLLKDQLALQINIGF